MDKATKKEISRLRSEVRKVNSKKEKEIKKEANPFVGAVTGNYWTQTGMPWASSEGRKGVLTEWFWQPLRGQPRRVDTNEIRQFAQTFWVYSCINTLLDEVSSCNWDIIPKEDMPYEQVEDGIIMIKEFLMYPNKNGESFTNLMRAVLKDILEVDAGVIEKVFDVNSYDFENIEPKSGAFTLKPLGQRHLTELYARDGASFLKETDKFGFCKGYWQYSYQIPAHPMWFDKDSVVYISRNSRSMSPYGFAPTQAILDIIKSLHYSVQYNKKFFEESAIPDGVLSVLDASESDMNNFRDMWTSAFKAQPHKFAVMNKQIEWKPMTALQQELQFLETQSWYYKLVISAFGLTPTELGLTDDVNRATASSQAELSRRKGVRPLLKILENFVNKEILNEFMFPYVEFQFIYDDPQEKNQRLLNWQLEVNMGIKTPNEVRNELGLAPIEGGDETRQQQAANQFNNYGSKDNGEGKTNDEKKNEERDKKDQESETKKAVNLEGTTEINQDLLIRLANTFAFHGDLRELEMGLNEEKEHIDVVGNDMNKIAQIALAHLKEDEHYYTKLRNVMNNPENAKPEDEGEKSPKSKGVDDGQYYREPLQVTLPSRGKISQPQNIMTCPFCGSNTLRDEANIDDVYGVQERKRCLACNGVFTNQEIEDKEGLARMENKLEENNSTEPVTKPNWSPKSIKKDIEMNTKDFVGFDYMKSYEKITEYLKSKEYDKLIKEYLKDLPQETIDKIKDILEEGLKKGWSLTNTVKKIGELIGDKERGKAIARTETVRITNEGQRQKAIERGFTKGMFLSAPEDGRLCEECHKHNRKVYSLKSLKGMIPLHPNCRCTFSEV